MPENETQAAAETAAVELSGAELEQVAGGGLAEDFLAAAARSLVELVTNPQV
ncbi:MAG TPA: hypothetical protein VEX86_14605 [Longimicrobium sp.]|nr:hypothetical protein [Longimicrobium sp.]